MSDDRWDDLVARGRKIVGDHNWTLGDIAADVETIYGGQDLERYARAIDVEPATLRVYRWVAGQWPAVNRLTDLPWTAHMVLAAQDDRFELIRSVATVRDARAIIKSRGIDPTGDVPDADDVPDFEPTGSSSVTRPRSSCGSGGRRARTGTGSA